MSLYNDCIDLAYGCMTQLPRSAPEAKIKDGPKSAIWAWLLALPAWLKVGAGIGLCLLILVPVLYFALRGKPTVLVIYGDVDIRDVNLGVSLEAITLIPVAAIIVTPLFLYRLTTRGYYEVLFASKRGADES
jgi:hypothetical protein